MRGLPLAATAALLLALPAAAAADSSCGPPPSGDMVALAGGAALATQGGIVGLTANGRQAKPYDLDDEVAEVPALSRTGPVPGTAIAAWRTGEGHVRAALLTGGGDAGASLDVASQSTDGGVAAAAGHVAWAAADGVHVLAVEAVGGTALQPREQVVVGAPGARLLGLTDGGADGTVHVAVSVGAAVDVITPNGATFTIPRAADPDAGFRLAGQGDLGFAAWVDGRLKVAAVDAAGAGTTRSLGVRPLSTPWNPAGFAFDAGPGGWVAAWSAVGRGGRADVWRASIAGATRRVTSTRRYDEFADDVDATIRARPIVSGTRSVQRSRAEITGNDRPVAAALWSPSGATTIVAAPKRGEESSVRVARAGDSAFAAWDHFDLDDQDGDLRARRVRPPVGRFPSPVLVAAPHSCSTDEG